MALIVRCEDAQSLLDRLRSAIDEGTVTSWRYDSDGDLKLLNPQWRSQGWMRPAVKETRLVFNAVSPQGQTMTSGAYAALHTGLISELLKHLDSYFTSVQATAIPSANDII